MKININKIKVLNIIAILLGFFMLTYFIWFRFIRERLPKEIPFALTSYSFISLSFICGIYIYVLIRILKPKPPHEYLLTFMKEISKLFYPLIMLDDTFKKHTDFMEYMMSFIIKLITKLKLYNTDNYYNFYLVIYMGPKLILLFAFLFDIFYFSKLELFFTLIPLSLIPLLYNYLMYSLKKQLEIYLQFLDKNFYVNMLTTGDDDIHVMYPADCLKYEDYHDTNLNILKARNFVLIQTDNLVFDYKDLYSYNCIETWEARCEYAKKHNIKLVNLYVFIPNSDDIAQILAKTFFELMPKTVYLQAFIKISEKKWYSYKLILRWNIFIIGLYLLGWAYILLISIYTLPPDSFTWLWEIQDLEEPFSILKLII